MMFIVSLTTVDDGGNVVATTFLVEETMYDMVAMMMPKSTATVETSADTVIANYASMTGSGQFREVKHD